MKEGPLDICVVTYNRLEYLKHCVWSIIMSTNIPYRLFVLSDCSDDGTEEWLNEMEEHGKIFKVIYNEENLGSPKSFNKVINATDSEWFVMACDDIYFHRGWHKAATSLIDEFDDCGIASFWDFPLMVNDTPRRDINDHAFFRQSTGLAGSLIKRDLFDAIGGFVLPEGIKMGYFASKFCKAAKKTGLDRYGQYLTLPPYATQMDRQEISSLNYLYWDYALRRNREKNKHKKFMS